MDKLELIVPVNSPFFVQGFGANNTDPLLLPKYQKIGLLGHNGWDLVTGHGKPPIYASHSGTVVYAGLDGSNGYLVVIKTDREFEYKSGSAYFKTLYGHLLPPIPVRVGQHVRIGDFIAYPDSTGWSEGDHLHWGLKPVAQGEPEWVWFNIEQDNGYNGAIDPSPYVCRKQDGTFYTPKDVQNIWQTIAELKRILGIT